MANPIVRIYPNDDKTAYIVEYCDGTSDTIPALCCDDGVNDVPIVGNPLTPSGTRCDLAYRFAYVWHILMNNGGGYFSYNLPTILPFQVQKYMLDYQIPIGYYTPLFQWALQYGPAGETSAIGEFWAFDDSLGLEAMACCLSETEGFTDAWIDCYVDTFTASANMPEPYPALVKSFMKIWGQEYLQNRVLATNITVPQTPSLCGDCDNPVGNEPQGCSPENEPFSKKYTHKDPELLGVRACYPANHYDSCSAPGNDGHNSVRNNHIEIEFPGFVCVRRVIFNYAGNGQVDWKSVNVIAWFSETHQETLATDIAVVGRTNCQTGLPVSFDMTFPTPAVAMKLLIVPNRVVGAGGASAYVDIHCVTVTGGIIPSEPI